MKYLLDTHLVIHLIRHKPPELLARLRQYAPGEVGISALTLAELHYGAAASQSPRNNEAAVEGLMLALTVAPFGEAAGQIYGPIRAALERLEVELGSMDTLIAAHAHSLGVVLVTTQAELFERVPGLAVEDWEGDKGTAPPEAG